ncbi:hypothetical protein D9756_006196 [Leucocoprinus leucothites]|uniref:Uncharacterized protein n=1 Tax=Leucocoprinus leucothites TaxID=201217 RepID=A0A8H5D341_9AGAR|nr:hypothetical protein D9756_006196 [Leucoagaricus leucothites]
MAATTPAYKEVAVTFISALVGGVYITSVAFCYRWLFFADEGWKLRKKIYWVTVVATSIIFLLNVIYPAIFLRGVMEMVKLLEDNPGARYTRAPWDRILWCTSAIVTVLIADCILIYRCWVVYERRSIAIIVFPAILWLGGLACTILMVYFEIAHTRDPKIGGQVWRGLNESLGPGFALIPFLALTVTLNSYTTCMLMRRINAVARKSESATARQFRYIARIFAESGVLCLSITVAQLIAWFTPNNIAIQVLCLINIPVVGISFNLVVIRSAQLRAEQRDPLQDAFEGGISRLQFQDRRTGSATIGSV